MIIIQRLRISRVCAIYRANKSLLLVEDQFLIPLQSIKKLTNQLENLEGKSTVVRQDHFLEDHFSFDQSGWRKYTAGGRYSAGQTIPKSLSTSASFRR